MTLEDRAERLKNMRPQLIAELTLFPSEQSTRTQAIVPGWGCPCFPHRNERVRGWDGWPILDEPLALGAKRAVGFVFLSGHDAVQSLAMRPSFHLWERGFIGEARILKIVESARGEE